MPSRPITISAAFDAGNIERVPSENGVVALKIRPDIPTELEKKTHSQWWYFRSSGASGTTSYAIVNADEVSYPSAWPGYLVCASTDRQTWSRVPSTKYDGGTLSWTYEHAPGGQTVYFAYFDPYSYERQLDLVARCEAAEGASVRSLGKTLDGREMDCVEVGTGPLQAWVIHRQHPGETQASFYAEGLLNRLLGLPALPGAPANGPDGLATRLRETFTFHIIPNMNPDGATRGHLRTNACGANLNREWATTGDYVAPTLERSPEVYHTLAAMDATGVDVFVDVHGDEALPVAFIAGMEGLAVWGPRLKALQGALVASYERANPDMQRAIGYEPDKPMEGNLAICSNQVAQRFNCLGVTLEMPFKDNHANLGKGGNTFQGGRCMGLGASLLDALAHVAPYLRNVDAPSFPPEDAYVTPTEDEAVVAKLVAEAEAARDGAPPAKKARTA